MSFRFIVDETWRVWNASGGEVRFWGAYRDGVVRMECWEYPEYHDEGSYPEVKILAGRVVCWP